MAQLVKAEQVDDLSMSSIVAGVDGDGGCLIGDGKCAKGASDAFCLMFDGGCEA